MFNSEDEVHTEYYLQKDALGTNSRREYCNTIKG